MDLTSLRSVVFLINLVTLELLISKSTHFLINSYIYRYIPDSYRLLQFVCWKQNRIPKEFIWLWFLWWVQASWRWCCSFSVSSPSWACISSLSLRYNQVFCSHIVRTRLAVYTGEIILIEDFSIIQRLFDLIYLLKLYQSEFFLFNHKLW